jgi:hypothetical protein
MLKVGHGIGKAHIRNLRGPGRISGHLPISHRDGLSETPPRSSHPKDGHAEQDETDFQNATSEGVRFHGFTLPLPTPRVLIVKIVGVIDLDDGGGVTV